MVYVQILGDFLKTTFKILANDTKLGYKKEDIIIAGLTEHFVKNLGQEIQLYLMTILQTMRFVVIFVFTYIFKKKGEVLGGGGKEGRN